MNDIKVEVDNLELWDKWGKTDPSITKTIKRGGRNITTVDAYKQIEMATKEWGLMGQWGLKYVTVEMYDEVAFMTATFFYPHPKGGTFEFVIINSIDTMTRPRGKDAYRDSEWAKKLQTDTITKAFSYVGMNHDIFMGKFDDQRYVAERKTEEHKATVQENSKLYDECIAALDKAKEHIEDETYEKYKQSLGLSKDDPSRLKVALGVIRGIKAVEPE